MRNIIALALIALLAWYGHSQYQRRAQIPNESAQPMALESSVTSVFKCDGRTRCSQMTSCAEATYFLQNCPDTKMDGDHDGIPCEQQWCH
jgi:hypothetical protein